MSLYHKIINYCKILVHQNVNQKNHGSLVEPREAVVRKCSIRKLLLKLLQLYLKRDSNHKCFPMNFLKFLRRALFIEHLRWLLLNLHTRSIKTRSFEKVFDRGLITVEVFCKKKQLLKILQYLQENICVGASGRCI